MKFPPTRHFVSDAQLGFTSFSTHASRTGNATSQAHIAFFYSTGYRGVVQVDQAKAQLYYTFAANGGDKGAQMTLGYRYWSGIGTSESCERAVVWYESASEQGKSDIHSFYKTPNHHESSPSQVSIWASGRPHTPANPNAIVGPCRRGLRARR